MFYIIKGKNVEKCLASSIKQSVILVKKEEVLGKYYLTVHFEIEASLYFREENEGWNVLKN